MYRERPIGIRNRSSTPECPSVGQPIDLRQKPPPTDTWLLTGNLGAHNLRHRRVKHYAEFRDTEAMFDRLSTLPAPEDFPSSNASFDRAIVRPLEI